MDTNRPSEEGMRDKLNTWIDIFWVWGGLAFLVYAVSELLIFKAWYWWVLIIFVAYKMSFTLVRKI